MSPLVTRGRLHALTSCKDETLRETGGAFPGRGSFLNLVPKSTEPGRPASPSPSQLRLLPGVMAVRLSLLGRAESLAVSQ